MTDEEILLKKRFIELAKKSEERSYFTFTDFLGLAERSVFSEAKSSLCKVSFTEFGGADGCERVMIRFGSEEELGYSEPFPITVLKIEPRAAKFADRLTHRDFLGSILGLGIERDAIGDVAVQDAHTAVVFCPRTLGIFLKEMLEKVGNDTVKCSDYTPDEHFTDGRHYKHISDTVASERLDCVVAALCNCSRDDAQNAVRSGQVEVDFEPEERVDFMLHAPATVSVRGYGRFILRAFDGETRKGRLRLRADQLI